MISRIMYSMSIAAKERPVRATQAKRGLMKEREKLFAKLQEINAAIEEAGARCRTGMRISAYFAYFGQLGALSPGV